MVSENSNLDISVVKKVNENLTFFGNSNGISLDKVLIKSKEDIISRMFVDYSLSMSATYALDKDIDLIEPSYKKIDEKYNVNKIMSPKDKTTIYEIIEEEYSIRELEDISWLLEDVRVYMWVLGLLEKPSFDKECDIEEINKVLYDINDYDELLNKCVLRSKEEIIEYFNLIIKDRNVVNRGEVNPLVIQEQIDALSFVTTYNVTEDFKSLICVNFKNKDINVEFNVREDLLFNKIGVNTKELFTLSSRDNKIRMVMFDFGYFDKDFEEKVKKYQDLFLKNGFQILNKYTLSSPDLKDKIYQTLISKGNVVLNSYLFTIQNHILRLDSLVDNSINYNDYNELVSSNNSNIDMDLLFSIKEHNQALETEVINEHNYSNLIPSKSNVNELIKCIEDIYNEILKNKRSGKLEFSITIFK